MLYQTDLSIARASALDFTSRFGFDWISQHVLELQGLPLNTSAVAAEEEWNVMHHMGGNSPWFPKTKGILQNGLDVPLECWVDQVHMVRLSSPVCTKPWILTFLCVRYLGMRRGIQPSWLV